MPIAVGVVDGQVAAPTVYLWFNFSKGNAMSLSFSAAIQILTQAQERIRESENMEASVIAKLEEASGLLQAAEAKLYSAMGMQRQTGDHLEEAMNQLKMVFALSQMEGMGPVLDMTQNLISDCHYKMANMIKELIDQTHHIPASSIPATKKEAGVVGADKMERLVQAIEEVKGT